MPALFETLTLIQDSEPWAAAWNMALDEALLRQVREPVLRIYGWRERAVSFGCFERHQAVAAAYPRRISVRRWTGGGVVPHGEDFTYSLIVPAADPVARMRALESYERIHAGVAAALTQVGVRAQITGSVAAKVSTACFENAVPGDVLADGQKIAGAAQRRTREGLLHQGSIQRADLPPGFGRTLAGELGTKVVWRALDPEELTLTQRLVETKYGTRAWLEKY